MGESWLSTIAPGNTTTPNQTNIDVATGLETRPEAYVVPVVFAFIFITGIVGNGTLIFIVCRNKNMRNVPNIFIVSLAIGDLLLILVSVPFTSTIYTFTEWPYGLIMCKVNEFLQTLSLGVSVFTLTALSGDRFVAIVDPMKRHRTASTAITLTIAASIWVFSGALAVLDLVGATMIEKQYDNKVFEFCVLHPKEWGDWYPKFHTIFRFIVYLFIPMCIIGIFYLLMAIILITSSRKFPGGDTEVKSQQQLKQMEARKKVAKLVLSVVFVFVICWLPRHIYLLWWHFDPSDYNLFWHVFKIVGFCLCFMNSCINPLALYFLSKQFRTYFNRYLCCCVRVHEASERRANYSNMYSCRDTSTNYNLKDGTGVRRTSTTMTMLTTQSVLLMSEASENEPKTAKYEPKSQSSA